MTKWLAGRTFPQPPCGDSRGGHVHLVVRMVYMERTTQLTKSPFPIESEQYPGNYCLPGDTEIAKVISSSVQKEKNKTNS